MEKKKGHVGAEQFRRELCGLMARHGHENDLKIYELLGMMLCTMFDYMLLAVENEEDGEDEYA